jgi:hypothetical protein
VFGAAAGCRCALAVTGRGRIVISLTGPTGATIARRVVIVRRRAKVLAFASAHPPRGAYIVTVSASRSKLPDPVRLTALVL